MNPPSRRKFTLWRVGISLVILIGLGVGITGFLLGPRGRGRGPRHPGTPVRPDLQQIALTSSDSNLTNGDRSSESAAKEAEVRESDREESNGVEGEATLWSRFRGPNGTGVCPDTNVPIEWSGSKNLKWSTELPGPGSSSPVLTDRYVFVTCYSGIQRDGQGGGTSNLKRILVSVDREDGKVLWTHEEPAVQPEDAYRGMGVPEHGYATNTPVTDGKRVYAFLGKSGVLAFDVQGKKLWQTGVGKESGNRGWGTASSLVLYEDLVIVNASEESQSIRALNASTGEEVWKAAASSLELAYGTPVLVPVDSTRTDLVIAVPGEVWGLNPKTGKLLWYAETKLAGNVSPSLIVDGENVIAFGGFRSSGSVAIRVGGSGDVTKSHTVWSSSNSSYVSTPVLVDGKLYWIDDRGTYYVSSAKTGELIKKSRVADITTRDRPVYASAVAIGQHLYFQTRFDGLLVAKPNSDWSIAHQNRFDGDTSMCNATPATDRGELYLRSDAKLYCVRSN